MPSSRGVNPQPFGFTGQQADNDGLVYLRARYYDPSTGRFMSRDPVAGAAALPLSLNRYVYVQNNPGLSADPSGLSGTSRTLNDGWGDDPCHSTAGGNLGGYLVNAACTSFVALGQGAAVVRTALGALILPTSFAAAPPPRGGGPGAGQETSERAARRAAFRWYKIPTSVANNFKRIVQWEDPNGHLTGPNGEPYETIESEDVNGRPVTIDNHKWGHVFTDEDNPQDESPHYSGPKGTDKKHFWYFP